MSFWFFHLEHYLLASSCDKYRVDFLSYPFTSTLFIPYSHPHAPNTIIPYFGLDGWSVSTGSKQIILCFLLLFSVIFSPGVNHSLFMIFSPFTNVGSCLLFLYFIDRYPFIAILNHFFQSILYFVFISFYFSFVDWWLSFVLCLSSLLFIFVSLLYLFDLWLPCFSSMLTHDNICLL